jgi:uncharacterized membrane protein
MNNRKQNNTNFKKITIIAVAAILLVVAAYSFDKKQAPSTESKKTATEESSSRAKEVKDKDIIIPVSKVTDNPGFYPAEINGTKLEVIAVKAPDGTIRTAFNTCQVCYSSGRGYYKVEGDRLVCQNCGNSFGMGDVEVTKGGCNPVPITKEYKSVNDKNITISKDVLKQATEIFANWKN